MLIHCSKVHYAIIQASSVKDHPERLVIAYPDENCLRDLIAGPSIIRLGFTSRGDALANLQPGGLHAAVWKLKRRPTGTVRPGHENRDLGDRGGPEKSRKILFGILQCALSTAIVFVYSKNLISAMIRQALGVSF